MADAEVQFISAEKLGCTIVVYDRDENACERAKEAGAKICEYKDLSKVLKKAAFLFNTAPSAVWTEGLLEGVLQEVCILELASMPGGIDRDAADRLGIHIMSCRACRDVLRRVHQADCGRGDFEGNRKNH